MSDEPNRPIPTPTPPGGGATYGQADFVPSAQRSKARTERVETARSRSAPKTPAAPKPKLAGG